MKIKQINENMTPEEIVKILQEGLAKALTVEDEEGETLFAPDKNDAQQDKYIN